MENFIFCAVHLQEYGSPLKFDFPQISVISRKKT